MLTNHALCYGINLNLLKEIVLLFWSSVDYMVIAFENLLFSFCVL